MGSYQIPRWISRYWKDPRPIEDNDELSVHASPEPIAIIGISAALPMAADLDEFWSNLVQGKDCITTVPPDRSDWDSIRSDSDELRIEMRKGGFIAGADEFDSLFFNISPREAGMMDPHQRLLLMHTWRAIEDAGYAPRSLAGSDTGVFTGVQVHDFVRILARADRQAEGYTSTGLLSSVTSNRISHYLDFRGPNEAIDTACSSSLVALHRAVRAIQSGECELAIAAAAHLLLTPYLYGSYGRAGMLSPDARCKAFSSEANGYVRSEGVGVFLLKRLSAAVRDRDHIHGVVRSTIENHGGAARSLTAPNPRAQADLVYRAYSLVDADPSTIGYIECHGTGTPLGDPIEVEALKSAFDRLCDRRGVAPQVGYCGLGSVKGNIGHLEIAAGIAGLIKVVLQLRHRMLAPTLHSQPRNPYVVTDGTPFYVVEEARSWESPMQGDAHVPRRAGVSSFGFGGVNAHALIEEHCAPPREATSAQVFPIVVSGRSARALQRQVAALLKGIEGAEADASRLLDISYTLSCGREAMAHRLGFVVDSGRALTERLRAIRDGAAPEDVRQGHVDLHQAASTENAPSRDALEGALGSVAAAAELVDRWVSGGHVDWKTTFREHAPHRCSLPPYVFEMARFPLPQSVYAPRASSHGHGVLRLSSDHVLQRRVDVALEGDESFLVDHTIGGARLLPAAAYLELVRAAFESAEERSLSVGARTLRLHDVEWLAPFAAAGPGSLSVWLHGDESDGARFEVGSRTERSAPDMLYAKGRIERIPAADRPRLNIETIRDRCRRATYAPPECYDAFSRIGFAYGPTHRTIRELHVGNGEAVAQLALPELAPAGFVLHPAILDGALQAVVGSHLDAATAWQLSPASRPSGCKRVEIFHASSAAAWAVLRWDDGAAGTRGDQTFDIDLCDEEGRLCVRFAGLSFSGAARDHALTRPAAATANATSTDADAASRALFVAPVWIPLEHRIDPASGSRGKIVVVGGAADVRAALSAVDSAICFVPSDVVEDDDRLRRVIVEQGEISRLLWLVDADVPSSLADDAILDAQSRGVFLCLKLAQALLAAGYGDRALDWLTVTERAVSCPGGGQANPVHAGLQGMIGSIAREYPAWRPRLLDVPSNEPLPLDALARADFSRGPVLAYRNRHWHERRMCTVAPPPVEEYTIAPGSVCLIIGGAGGLGQVFSRALLQRSPDIRIVWMGRRPREAVEAAIDELAPLGPPVHYVQGDAADRESLESARREIEERFGKIDGLIHAAMSLSDRSVERLSADELRAVLAPKVAGSLRLAQVFDPDRLKFVLFFSSMNAFATMPGQSNYAAANCFEDAFALAWGQGRRCRVRVVNWGYWGDVGAVASEYHRAKMARIGIGSIRAPEAVNAALRILNAPLMQYGYLQVGAAADIESLGVDRKHHLEIRAESSGAAGEHPPAAPKAETPLRDVDALIAEDRALEGAIVDVLWSQLSTLCVFDPPRTREAVRVDAGIIDAYRPWFERSVNKLIRHGHLDESDGLLRAKAGAAEMPGTQAEEAWTRLREPRGNTALREYANSMLQAVPGVVTGRQSAVDAAFSDSVSTSAADSYFNDPAIRHCSVVLADIAAEYVARRKQQDSGARIRLLEIGAGRGATTRRVVDALRPHADAIAEYAFTDISPAFIASGRRAELSLPAYVEYRTFNVEIDPERQGLHPGTYDIVIAANVLHATEDLESTLRHCKALLKRDGVLLLQELTDNPVYTHVTYGLLEGWWRFADPWLRVPGGPAVSPPAWAELLALAGFRNVSFPAASAHALSHQVVFAESDGTWLRSAHGPAEVRTDATTRSAKREDVRAESGTTALDAKGGRRSQMDTILSQLRTTAAEVLEVDEAVFENGSQPFADVLLTEYGMDSLSSINLRNALRTRFGIDVATQQLLGEKTLTIADAIYDQLLVQRLASRDQTPDESHSETFVF